MRTREATVADVEAVQRVARASWEAAYLDAIGRREVDAALDEWYSRDALTRAFADESVGYFVAEAEGIVGYASGRPRESGVGDLASIYVHPDRWGDGIGTRLLDRAEAFLAEHGMDRVQAVAIADNEVGTAFYRRHGFELVEEREAELFGGTTIAEHVYRRPLPR